VVTGTRVGVDYSEFNPRFGAAMNVDRIHYLEVKIAVKDFQGLVKIKRFGDF
jgi:hypothetical protein